MCFYFAVHSVLKRIKLDMCWCPCAWVNQIMRFKEWKTCSSVSKKAESFGFLLQHMASPMFPDHLCVT